ncbi:MAG: DNA alkylation repair protein [Bacteroidota bacterium]
MHQYLSPLVKSFKNYADPEAAVGMKKYMRNQFEYIGLKTPLRRELFKNFLKEAGLPPKSELNEIINDLWEQPEREFQYAALELCGCFKKQIEREDIEQFEQMITWKSWWDTVDGIAPNLVGELFKKYPDMIAPKTKEWRESDNMWLQRSSIIFQLKYGEKTDLDLLFVTILGFRDSKEFFIQKAMGWALRQYAWLHPEIIRDFVQKHTLPPLTKREALKNINKMIIRKTL